MLQHQKETSWKFFGTISYLNLFFASREFFNLWGDLLVDGVKSLDTNLAKIYEREFIIDSIGLIELPTLRIFIST